MDYDLAVIGGGSGGLAAAKEASRLGAKTVCFDYVEPSPQGAKWGLGGTCVNVGCIPKILFHNSARIGQLLDQAAKPMGWIVPEENVSFDWATLVQTVQNYIKQLNFGYRNGLRSAQVTYVNARAVMTEPHTIRYTLKGQARTLTAKYIIIAVGGRPYLPRDIPGVLDFAISSDDLFSLKSAPNKTLVVGASYIALECAGALCHMGFPVKVAVRSIVLRGFDRECAQHIKRTLEEMGVEFFNGRQVAKIERNATATAEVRTATCTSSTGTNTPSSPHQFLVHFDDGSYEEFDTVLYATGRLPSTGSLGCDVVGIKLHETSGKILTDEQERTSVDYIYAVGDACHGRPELTPVAIKAGELLARRLFKEGETALMNYNNIPTVVFTPIEYGCCGLSEENAIARYGEDNIETYLYQFNPVPVSAGHWRKHPRVRENELDVDITPINFSKVICKKQDGKIVGYHCIGLNAGETTQGYALAVKCGLTKENFDEVVGIHPTDAESFHSLTITRRSGESYVAAGGCGGGKCG